MTGQRIRPLAVCVFRDADRILVIEAFDAVKREAFYRPLGGGIDFGESSEAALRREVREEIGAELEDLRHIGTLENIFTYNGVSGHEIVQVYDGRFVDASLYSKPALSGIESDGQPFHAVWRAVGAFAAPPPLYPAGLLQLLLRQRADWE